MQRSFFFFWNYYLLPWFYSIACNRYSSSLIATASVWLGTCEVAINTHIFSFSHFQKQNKKMSSETKVSCDISFSVCLTIRMDHHSEICWTSIVRLLRREVVHLCKLFTVILYPIIICIHRKIHKNHMNRLQKQFRFFFMRKEN